MTLADTYTHHSDPLLIIIGIVCLCFLLGYGALTDPRWKRKRK